MELGGMSRGSLHIAFYERQPGIKHQAGQARASVLLSAACSSPQRAIPEHVEEAQDGQLLSGISRARANDDLRLEHQQHNPSTAVNSSHLYRPHLHQLILPAALHAICPALVPARLPAQTARGSPNMSSRQKTTKKSSSGSAKAGGSRSSSGGSSQGSRASSSNWRPCPHCEICNGTGKVTKYGTFVFLRQCTTCQGRGYYTASGNVRRNCPGCSGRGTTQHEGWRNVGEECGCDGYY